MAAPPAGGAAAATSADAHRQAGNASFRSGAFAAAVASYTQALAAAPATAALLSNRSAAHARLRDWAAALADADACVALDAAWHKAHNRRGAALDGACRFTEAAAAYAATVAAAPAGASEARDCAAAERLARRRAAMLRTDDNNNGNNGGGVALVCDTRVDEAELTLLCAAAGEALTRLDAVDAPAVSPHVIAAALKSQRVPRLRLISLAQTTPLTSADRARLQRAAPSARLECVTDELFHNAMPALAQQPPADVIASLLVAPLLAHPRSHAVHVLLGQLLTGAAISNQAAETASGAVEALTHALASDELWAAPPEHAPALYRALCGALCNIMAATPAASARAVAAGAVEVLVVRAAADAAADASKADWIF
jgi:tetratricopeptide (TPR) repeat protein